MKKTIAICFLILLSSVNLYASDNSEVREEKYGLKYSSYLSAKENKKLISNKNEALISGRSTTWKSYPLYGGEMTSIVSDPNNPLIVYVGTRDAGVYKTTDGGASWSPARNGLTFYPIRSLAINPDNSGTLYAGTDYDGVWKSTDSGATWFKSSSGLDESLIIFNIVIDPQNPNILYAGLGGGVGLVIGNIYKSKDGGTTWEVSDDGLPTYSGEYKNAIFSLAINPYNSGIIYAGTNFDGAFMSTDTGKTWSAINDSLPIADGVEAIAVDIHHNGRVGAVLQGIYYIYNGSYWQQKSQGYEQIGTSHLYFHPIDTSVIYSSGDRFAKSINGGENWTDYLGWGSNTSCSRVADIAFTSLTPDTIFAATDILFDFDGGVFKSRDQGESWNECSNGITATAIRSVAIDPQNPNRIYAGEGNGHFYRTENGGTTWYNEHLVPTEINDIEVDPVNSSNIYLSASSGIYKSINHGENFSEIDGVEHPVCITIHPTHSNILYAGTHFGHGIYKTIDGGTTWVQKSDSLPGDTIFGYEPILSIAIDPNDTSIVWAGTDYGAGIVKSTNGGDYWVVKGLTGEDVQSIAVNPDNSNEILAGAGYNMYKSINGGDSWIKKDSSISFIYTIKYDPVNTGYVYAATEGYGVRRSADGGETWHDYSDGIFYPLVYSLDIAQNDSVLLVAGTYGSGLYYIYPELSGIDEQKAENKSSFLRKSSLEFSGSSATIHFNLPEAGKASLKLYDITGRQIRKIMSEYRPAGKNEVDWNTENIAAGIYFYNLELNGLKKTQKVTFIK